MCFDLAKGHDVDYIEARKGSCHDTSLQEEKGKALYTNWWGLFEELDPKQRQTEGLQSV